VNGRFGYILTCEHLFNEGAGQVIVVFSDGKKYQARIKAVNRTWDLAVLTLNGGSRIAAKMAIVKPQVGEQITYCGYGQGYGLNRYRCRSGKLLQYIGPAGLNRFEELDVAGASRGGDSGGPMFNSTGELVGVLTVTGIPEKKTVGPNCVIINQWLAEVLNKPVPTIDAEPPTPVPEPQPTPSKLAVLEAQIAELQAAVAALQELKPIPAGNDGERGLQGEQGEQGLQGVQGEQGEQGPKTEINLASIVDAVLAKIPDEKRIYYKISPKK